MVGKSDPMRNLEPELELLASDVIGAAIEVHRHLGPGLPEEVYRQAMCLELAQREINYICEHYVTVEYKGQAVGRGRIDLLVGNKLVLELKSVESLAPVFTSQTLTYLRITRLRLALLINFNVVMLKDGIKRIVL